MGLIDRIKTVAAALSGKYEAQAGSGLFATPNLSPAQGGTPQPQASDFLSVKMSRKRGQIHSHQPSDQRVEMTNYDRQEMVRKSRWLDKNNGFYRENIASMSIYAVGSGMPGQSQCGDESAADVFEDYFNNGFANNCDIGGRFSLTDLLHIWCRAIDRDGEVFVVLVRDENDLPKLQTIEAHRVIQSKKGIANMVDGVLFDPVGRVVGYNVILDNGVETVVGAQQVCHIFEPEYASAVRGYPTQQHAINNCQDVMEMLAFEKEAVKQNAEISRVIKRQSGRMSGDDQLMLGNATNIRGTDPDDVTAILGGKTAALAPDESLESFQSNRPNPLFDGFIELLHKDGSGGGLSYDFLFDNSKLSGPNLRLSIAKADRRVQHRQRALARALRKIWAYAVGDGIEKKVCPAVDGWMRVDFGTEKRVTVDAGREANANRMDIEFGLKTLTDDYAERGLDFKTEARKRARDIKILMEVSREFGVPFDALYKPQQPMANGWDSAPEDAPEPVEQEQSLTPEQDMKEAVQNARKTTL